MHLPSGNFVSRFLLAMTILTGIQGCSKEDKNAQASMRDLPPSARPADAPEFVRSLSLLYPQAELYRATSADTKSDQPGIILQKTNHPLESVVGYYKDALQKHGFTETTNLVQSNGALLQYERKTDAGADKRELVSIDISRLPYAENLLIRIGRSEADYSRGGSQ